MKTCQGSIFRTECNTSPSWITKVNRHDRNEAVAEFVKRGAQGICARCSRPAPFETKEGPYLECHHIVHLSKHGPDSVESAVALCPNCHRKMHVMDLAEDREVLMAKAALLSS